MKKLLLCLLILPFVSCSPNEKQSIKLNVSNTVEIPVEFVTISVTVSESGEDASAVELTGYENVAQVVNLLKENGIHEDYIEIDAGEISTVYYRSEEPFEFNSSLSFDLPDLDKIDTFRRAIIGAGGTSFRIRSYGNQDEESIYDDAYRNSINVAKERAERLLSNQNVEVGNILNIHENIQERVEMAMSVEHDLSEVVVTGYSMEEVDPLFNKKYYTKQIRFNVEFELNEL